MDDGKYYFLKLHRHFFKRHDIRIVESMPNGTDYILFYLKLLCESIDHEGDLRFSESIPYNDDMLSTITNTNIDIVRSAVKLFTELGMMEIVDDGTFHMPELSKMIGSRSNTDGANRVRRFREKKKALELEGSVTPALQNVTLTVTKDNESQSKSKRKSKSKNKRESKIDDLSILNKLTKEEQDSILDLCENLDNYAQLIRYADAKISQRQNDEDISDPYSYLLAVGINGGFIKED